MLRQEVDLQEETSGDPSVFEPSIFVPVWEPRRATTPQPRHDVGPSHTQPWRDIDLSNFKLPKTPFQRVQMGSTHLQNQYFKLEHITRGVSRALSNCGPGNIMREVARVTDRSKMQALETEKTQLAIQVAAMTQDLTQKNEDPRKYQAEQAMVLSRVRETWSIRQISMTS